jgi:hypothetical protein
LELFSDISDPDPANRFPDEPGWLVINFGYEDQVWPIRYFGRISNTELALDASHVFGVDLPAGTGVHYASQREPLVPNPSDVTYGLVATASPAGRIAAERLIDDTVAAGIPIQKDIRYPGSRGLGGDGFPTKTYYKINDIVTIFGEDDAAAELEKARNSE